MKLSFTTTSGRETPDISALSARSFVAYTRKWGPVEFNYDHSVPVYGTGTTIDTYTEDTGHQIQMSGHESERLAVFYNVYGEYSLRNESNNHYQATDIDQRLVEHCQSTELHTVAKSLLRDKWRSYVDIKKMWIDLYPHKMDPMSMYKDHPYGILNDLRQAGLAESYCYHAEIHSWNRVENYTYFALSGVTVPTLEQARMHYFYVKGERKTAKPALKSLGLWDMS